MRTSFKGLPHNMDLESQVSVSVSLNLSNPVSVSTSPPSQCHQDLVSKYLLVGDAVLVHIPLEFYLVTLITNLVVAYLEIPTACFFNSRKKKKALPLSVISSLPFLMCGCVFRL